MSLDRLGFFVIAILIGWLTTAFFMGRLHNFIASKSFSSTKVGIVLVLISLGLFLRYMPSSENLGQKIHLILLILAFLFGIGLIRIDNYKYLYGRDWENKKE